MASYQLKMLLSVIQVAFISCGLFFYIYWNQFDEKPYYEWVAFVYGLVSGFFLFLVAITQFILIQTRNQITSLVQMGHYFTTNCYKYYYALVAINLLFLLLFIITADTDKESLNFMNIQSLHFVAAYCISSVLFNIFSNDLLKRRTFFPNEYMFGGQGIFKYAYAGLIFIIIQLITLNYFVAVFLVEISIPGYTFYSLICLFLQSEFSFSLFPNIWIRIVFLGCSLNSLYSAVYALDVLKDALQKGCQITMIVILIIILIRLIHLIILDILRARKQNRDRQIIYEKIMDMIPKQKFMMENEFVCSICLMNLVKNQIVMKLNCSHIFHSECLKPWVRISNSCPNCRHLILHQFNQEMLSGHPQQLALNMQTNIPLPNENNQIILEIQVE